MEIVFILGRLALAAVFAAASLTKLRDLGSSRAALTEFGVPNALVRPLGLLLPLAELAVVLGLLWAPATPWASLAALVLLLVFTAAIATNLARGRRPACRCFGQLSAEPVGPSTLVRNGVLTALASAVVWHTWTTPPQGLLDLVSSLSMLNQLVAAFGALLVGALVVAFWLLAHVVKQQGRLLLRIEDLEQRLASLDGHAAHHASMTPPAEGLPVGARAPDFALRSLTGELRTLGELLHADRPLILIFTDPACGPCTALLPEIGGWQRALRDRVDIVVIGRGTVEANRARAAEHEVSPVLLQHDDEVADAYGVFGTPGAVLIRPDQTIGSPVAGGPEPIRSLVNQTAADPHGTTGSPLLMLPIVDAPADQRPPMHDLLGHQPTALPLGAPAPPFQLPDLDGALVDSASLIGQPTLLLFWNPGCAYCHQLLPTVRDWEARQPDRSLRLLVISEGTVEANRALGFQATVLRDDTLAVGMLYGVTGTPSAILIGADGAVASALAVGGAQIVALAAADQPAAK